MNNYNIACVIVTYNRKDLLLRCLNAVAQQTFKPKVVYITDNASTDGTIDFIKKSGLYNCIKDNIEYKYLLNSKNEGGSGGFYLGMRTAFEDNRFDALWVMDDDGEPRWDCLEILVSRLNNYDYIAPLVLSDKDHKSCSFTYNHETLDVFIKEAKIEEDGLIHYYSMPFNGVLFSAKYIKKVGFPKKEMFIWGDELNYKYRGYKHGFIDVTDIKAVHYHPLNKKEYIDYRNTKIAVIESDWKLYCFIRNSVYNTIYICNKPSLYLFKQQIRRVYDYWCYYKDIRNENNARLLVDAFLSGILGFFGGLKRYR